MAETFIVMRDPITWRNGNAASNGFFIPAGARGVGAEFDATGATADADLQRYCASISGLKGTEAVLTTGGAADAGWYDVTGFENAATNLTIKLGTKFCLFQELGKAQASLPAGWYRFNGTNPGSTKTYYLVGDCPSLSRRVNELSVNES